MHGEIEKRVVTLLVMSTFSVLPGAPRACVDLRDPTEDSRLNNSEGYLPGIDGYAARIHVYGN